MPDVVLITGAAGQDGWLAGSRLAASGCAVHGVVRPGGRADLPPGVEPVAADLGDEAQVASLVARLRPNRVLHLAAAHHSAEGAVQPRSRLWAEMVRTNFLSTNWLVEAVLREAPGCHLVYAASSQMFTASDPITVVDETTPRCPSTFYGHTKSWSADYVGWARATLGLRGSVAVLFNHESPRRAPDFVSRKISRAVAAIARGERVRLSLRNVGARADWSGAADVVDALLRMSAAPDANDYVIGSGVVHGVAEMLDAAFSHAGLEWRAHVDFERDEAGPVLSADPTRIRERLGWSPRLDLGALLREMVDADLAAGPTGRAPG